MLPSKPNAQGSPPKKKFMKDEKRRAKSMLKDMLEFTKTILKGAFIYKMKKILKSNILL